MDDRPELDRSAVIRLSKEMLAVVTEHYKRRPQARATAQEVLNAAAFLVGMIITAARACGDEDGARDFFELALEQQLAEGGTLPETMADLERATDLLQEL